MSPENIPMLSKYRFGSGLQFLKRPYLECHSRELAQPIDTAQQAIFDNGTEVGELARKRFPGGLLISEPYYEQALAEASTLRAMSDELIPAIY